jgi:type IV pilus assembly protein PilX
MLNATLRRGNAARPTPLSEQRGIVLVLALIVLAAMTLAGIGLMRSVFTSNRVAGNLAFQQAAVHSADAGIERAIAWLEDRNANSVTTLYQDRSPGGTNLGYFASRPRTTDPAAGQSWEPAWTAWRATGNFNTLPADAAGNTVEFVIHRLCNGNGAPESGIGCESSPTVVGSEGGSRGSGVVGLVTPSQRYYRITVRVAGPRNTVSFVQSIVAL